MDTFIQADIFFFITTIAVALVTIGLVIALVYAIKILHTVRKIADTIHTESGLIAEDVQQLRDKAHKGTITAGGIFHFFRDVFSRPRKQIKK